MPDPLSGSARYPLTLLRSPRPALEVSQKVVTAPQLAEPLRPDSAGLPAKHGLGGARPWTRGPALPHLQGETRRVLTDLSEPPLPQHQLPPQSNCTEG